MKPRKDRSNPTSALSPAKIRAFRVVGLVVLPLLVLLCVEGGLRLAGYGYSTRFFRRVHIGAGDYFIENDKFGLRFFPVELARSPAPVVMEAKKPRGTFRIFLLGESAALGDPRPAYGAGRYLQALLAERYPAAKFEVICGAVTAIDSHAILPIARECAHHDGDLWIVYMGNNEMIGPFGATTVFGAQSPPLSYVRFVLAVQETRLGQLLTALGRKLTAGKQARSSWGGMRMFLENRIGPQDKRKEVVYESFRKNLEDILRTARRAGVPAILSTVAVNLKDCAPFFSLAETNLPAQSRALYDESFLAALRADSQSNYVQSAVEYEKAARVAPLSAEVQFRWALALLAQTNPAAAFEHFEKARDFDELPFRADSSINRVIRETAAKETGPSLVFDDVVGLVATNSLAGIAGKEWFYEHVHFNFDGNYRVARSWAVEAVRFLPAWVTNGAAADWATQDVCERGLGLTDWNRFSVLEDVVSRLSQPPFTGQANHQQQIEELQTDMREVRSRMNKAAVTKATEIYHAALQKAQDDHRLHENFAEFLDLTGNLTASVTEWKRVAELLPQHHLAFFQTGRLLRRMAKLDEARLWIGKAVALRPDLSEGWLELGNIHATQGMYEEALNEYTKARQLTPQDYRVYYHTGKALSKLHRGPEAMENFQEALRLRPRYWEARYALGEELAFSNHAAEARREFEQVIKEKPDYALAHFNLGVALVKLGEPEGALDQFEETLRLDPNNQTVPGYIEKLQRAKIQR